MAPSKPLTVTDTAHHPLDRIFYNTHTEEPSGASEASDQRQRKVKHMLAPEPQGLSQGNICEFEK